MTPKPAWRVAILQRPWKPDGRYGWLPAARAARRHLEDDIASVAHHLRADLDQLLLQARQRPVLDWPRCCKRAEKVAKIVGERMKLEPHGVGRERPARQPCPLDRALAFLDPLFARPALIVEGDDPLGWARQVGDDETDAR